MPVVTCPVCRGQVVLPDPWTASGFTCPFCGRPATLPLAPPLARPPAAPPATGTAAAPFSLDDERPGPRQRQLRGEVRRTRRPRGTVEHDRGGMMVWALVAVVGLLICGGAIFLVTRGPKQVDEPNRDTARVDRRPPVAAPPETPRPNPTQEPNPPPVKETTAPKAEPPKPEQPVVETKPEPSPEPRPPVPVKPEPAVNPAETPSAEIAVAPPPRRVGHRVPPGKWVSDWQQEGDIRVRILSVAVRPAATIDPKGKPGQTAPLLTVWVEVENVGEKPRELRWWQTPFEEHATMRTNLDRVVGRGHIGAGTRIPELGESRRPLLPGEPPLAALLLFSIPAEEVLFLNLSLDAKRVGEKYAYTFKIPAKAWK